MKDPAQTRILIADDHTLVRAGIRALLEKEPSLEVLGEARDGREALELARQYQPDVLLIDIAMPQLSGLDVVRKLTREAPGVRCIILSMHADEEHVWQALRAGAAGYLVKGGSLVELQLAIKAVASGKSYLSPVVSGPVIKEYVRRTSQQVSLYTLTPRKREILKMIAEGKTTKQIALILEISGKTVESHRAQLMKQLGVQDIAGLVRHALKSGLVE